jgi:hypothetical protein
VVKILSVNFKTPKFMGYNTYKMKPKQDGEVILDSTVEDVQASYTERF